MVWQQVGTPQTPYGFTGESTAENGLVYLRVRYYDPILAVFQSLDPLETPNRYAYVDANPVNLVDPTGLAPFCKPQEQDTCATPEDKQPIETAYELTFSNSPSGVCWTKTLVDNTGMAFGRVQDRISRSFTDVFGGLTFALVDSGVRYARTVGSTVQWNKAGIDIGTMGDFQVAIVHELGHVLENRTRHLAPGRQMANVAKGRVWSRGSDQGRFHGNPSVPDRFSVSANPGAVGGTIDDDPDIIPELETVADYFMFWIYDSFNQDKLGRIASIYAQGGIIIRNNRSTTNVLAYPFYASEYEINFTIEEYYQTLNDLVQQGIEPIIIDSPGMRYWVASARR